MRPAPNGHGSAIRRAAHATVGWVLTAAGVFPAAFAVTWIVDAAVPQAYPVTDPGIWTGAGLLGVAVLALVARAREDDPRHLLVGAGTGLLACALLVGAFYAVDVTPPPTVTVARSDDPPAASLDPNETYEEVPELASAVDELASSNRTEVLAARGANAFVRIEAFLDERTSDETDTVSWRGTVVEVHVQQV